MGQHRSHLGHAVHLADALARQIVQAVQIVRIGRDLQRMPRMTDADDRFHQRPLALLNVLPHRVQVGRQRHAGRENSFALLAFALSVELLPPLGHIKQLRIVAAQNLDLAALAIERRSARQRTEPTDSRSKGTSVPVAFSISCAPRTNSPIRTPAAASGNRPTGVSTE